MSASSTITGQLLIPDGRGSCGLSPGTVTVRDGRIVEITGVIAPRADFGTDASFICPGFVDAHVHLPQFDSIGVRGRELLSWLETVIFPAEMRWADAEYAGGMAARVAKELLSFGTTAVAAYATVHPEGTQAAIDALHVAGLTAHVGQVLMDQEAPPDLLLPSEEAIGRAAALRPRPRVWPSVTPRFAVSCSGEMLSKAGKMARETGWLIQTHLSETRPECELALRLHGGGSYTEIYARHGLLTDKTILAHGIWLNEEELNLIERHGSVIAHCPTANRFLRAGVFDRGAAIRAGVRVAVGSDVAGGPDRSMVRVARAMIDSAEQAGCEPPDAAACFHAITRGNALALGFRDIGELCVGRRADVLVVQPDIAWLRSPDPLSCLLHGWDDRWLRAVVLGGNAVEIADRRGSP